MHLSLRRSLRALACGAWVSFVFLPAAPLNAASNPLEQIFGKKKEDPPPKKKKKKPAASTKKSSDDDEDEKPSSATPRSKKKSSPDSTTAKSASASKTSKKQSVSTSSTGAKKSTTTTLRRKSGQGDTSEKAVASKSKTSPTPTPTPEPTPMVKPDEGMTSSIASDELKEFSAQPDRVKQLLETCLALTRRNLTYTYGSADPTKGGMDCSGFIYFTLHEAGFPDAPRQANEQYVWIRKKSSFQAVLSHKSDTFEIGDLRPGDLMFWTGTYDIDRDPPITHTMIYLGTSKKTGQRLMVGSSDGRTYLGQKRNGVSVFDFHVATNASKNGAPTSGRTPDFAGYGSIPGLR